jgi:hypothetical protein
LKQRVSVGFESSVSLTTSALPATVIWRALSSNTATRVRWYLPKVRLRPADTTEEAWAVVEEGLRKMTPAQRVRRCIDLTVLTHRIALAEIRRRHPDENDRTHRLRLAARLLDAKTMKAAFGFVDDRR